jgi:hypothetical protein
MKRVLPDFLGLDNRVIQDGFSGDDFLKNGTCI